MISDSQKHKIIKEFFIPDEIKDDIAYCQRSLRDCVKVHQYFAKRCQSLSLIQQEQVKRYIHELENEMMAIGKDQNELVQDLARRLKQFQRKTVRERSIELGDDLVNGYVTRVLSNHCEFHCSAAYVPHSVSERMTETQLYLKYPLELAGGSDPSALPNMVVPRETRLRKRPVLQTSLLKPKEERDLLQTASKQKPSKTAPPPMPTPMPLPPPPATVAKMTSSGGRRKTPPKQRPVAKKMLRSSSTLSVKQDPPVKPEPQVKQEPRVTQEPMDQDLNDDSEDQSTMTTIRESAAVKRGRSNLLQALNKVKTNQKTSPKQPQGSSPTSAAKTGRNNRAGSVNAGENRSPSVSSDSCNSRASTPGTSNNACGSRKLPDTGDEPLIERLNPPEEPPSCQATNIHDMDQYSYLKLFALYTIEDSNLLKGRKNERKRRSCCSTERKDFHYGRLDYYEQQFYIVQKRRPNANKRLLYTTTVEKSIKNRKSWPNGMLPPPPSQPMPDEVDIKPPKADLLDDVAVQEETEPEQELESNMKVCLICKKNGPAETLSACIDCSNNYHSSCLKDEAGNKTTEKTDPDDDGGSDENDNRSAAEQLSSPGKPRCPGCVANANGGVRDA